MEKKCQIFISNEPINMKVILLTIMLFFIGCNKVGDSVTSQNTSTISFTAPKQVNVNGYSGVIMEPFLSRDGNLLFFNNSNSPSINTNIHYAVKVDDLNFEYKGELQGVNTASLDAVSTMDKFNNFYFVSTRSYNQNYSTIYRGHFSNGTISNIELVQGISRNQPGWVNFDVEVSEDGNSLYFVDGRFDGNGGPFEANIVLTEKFNGSFQRVNNETVLANINSDALEYAACISSNSLELYFTRVDTPLTNESIPQIYVATRNNISEPFDNPYRIVEISGFVEAPTISQNDSIIYYHKRNNNSFMLYMVKKK